MLARARAWLVVFSMACGGIERYPGCELAPSVVMDPAIDSALGEVVDIAPLGTEIALLDRQAGRVVILGSAGRPKRLVGGPGDGPGEFRRPSAITTSGDTLIVVADPGRRRLVFYSQQGRLIADVPMAGGISGHEAVGRILALGRDTLLDFWLTDRIPRYIPGPVFDTLPLVGALRYNGLPWSGGWGTPLPAPTPGALMLRMGMQSGDIAVFRDSLYVLRNVPGRIDVFGLNDSRRDPGRTIRLRRWRRIQPPAETGTTLVPSGTGEPGLRNTGAVALDRVALAFTIGADQRLYVVQRGARPESGLQPFPPEILAVYDIEGRLRGAMALPTLATRRVLGLQDGRLALLGLLGGPLEGNALVLFNVPADSTLSACRQ